jgi:hypothetical protein
MNAAELGVPSNYIEHDAVPMPYPYYRHPPEMMPEEFDAVTLAGAVEGGEEDYYDESFDNEAIDNKRLLMGAGEVRDDDADGEIDKIAAQKLDRDQQNKGKLA